MKNQDHKKILLTNKAIFFHGNSISSFNLTFSDFPHQFRFTSPQGTLCVCIGKFSHFPAFRFTQSQTHSRNTQKNVFSMLGSRVLGGVISFRDWIY